ncbi:hypothetical protein AALP_AA2G114400 [Arabis alpina]|uniref:Bifunctional inhibitor/plant lipid transfer protein/seed storage helical domain-containing protein n=1 Tax=Arabis alpina TaxID=50452 RepID=A0A087HGR5_ARAAL|nr:hypothetical protein AALP_AA2G114400 [Arabis alpina]
MANKLFLVCTALAFCFLLTNASIYRTVVEFDEDDDTNPIGPQGPKQKCQKEFQQSQHLRACQQWIRMRAMKPRYGPGADDELDFEDDFENPQGPQQQHPLLQKCCSELRQEEPVCVCPTLKQAAKAVRLQGQHGPFQVSKIFKTARNLPNVCNIPQVDVCPFKAIPFLPPYY